MDMLIDDVKIKIKAGDGGRGVVAFNNIKMALGPTGGNGGDGGNVYFEGVSDIGALRQFQFKKEVEAISGQNGKSSLNDGADGADLILKIPVGTVVHNLTVGDSFEITKIGERIFIAKGGRGGKGNFKFRSSVNTTPEQFQMGLPGEEFNLRLELKLIADVGLIGLPNVGKSSLLNELTNAKSRVANYQFTTLEPNLGVYFELVLADIPGLIEGASDGKGLGIKFLRHIERTNSLFHLISAESADPVADYKTIRAELGSYNKCLLDKPEFVFITKYDMVTAAELKNKLAMLKKNKISALPISIHDIDSLNKVEEILRGIIKEKILIV